MSTNEIMPKLKDFLCENLGIDADVLEFDTQLFGDGEIGLDSIDSLEIIVLRSRTWHVFAEWESVQYLGRLIIIRILTQRRKR